MKIKRVMLIASMLVLAGAADATEGPQRLSVCLQLDTSDPHSIIPLAETLAARMFAEIGILLDWKSCVRIRGSSQATIVVELVTNTPEDLMPTALAYALPYEGSHITVFYDRIEGSSYPGFLLAHVMVHEITHILQGISRHSETGVMKARWTDHDRNEMRYKALPFTSEDVYMIYNGLSARREIANVAR